MPSICLKCVACEMLGRGLPTGQRYRFDTPHGVYEWDIDEAMRLINPDIRGRAERGEFVTFTPDMMEFWINGLGEDAIDLDHVLHVDPTFPGIVSQAWDCKERRPACVLIDGAHRMAAALVKGLPFSAMVLRHAESMRCLTEAPELTPDIVVRMANMEAFPFMKGR